MYFDKMIHLEQNGFFTATWLVKSGDEWGLWPDSEGNRNHQDDCFVIWFDDLNRFVLDALTVATTRITIASGDLIIEPNDGDHTAIQVRRKDTEAETQPGQSFLGLKIGADTGNIAVIWYMQSLLMIRIVASGSVELLEKWEEGRDTHYGGGVPGKDWDYEDEEREIYAFDGQPTWHRLEAVANNATGT